MRDNTIPTFNERNPDRVMGINNEERELSRERVNLKYKEEYRWYMRKKEEFNNNFAKFLH